MDWLYYTVLIVLQVTGLVLNLFGVPGLWLMLIATGVYKWVTNAQGYVSWWGLAVLLVLVLLAELVEFVAGSAGAKKAGGGKLGMFAAMVGGIVGAIAGTPLIPIPIVGTIVGAVAGSFLGAWAVEYGQKGDVQHAMRVGWGAGKGRLWGILGKSTVGVVILLVTIVIAFPAGGNASPPFGPVTNPAPATVPSTTPATTPATLPSTLPVVEKV